MAGHGEWVPDIRGTFTVTPVVAHRKGIPVRLFGEVEGGTSPTGKRDTHSDAGVSFLLGSQSYQRMSTFTPSGLLGKRR